MSLPFDAMRFFRPRPAVESDPEDTALNDANELLDFAATSYYRKFIDWLENESFRPLKVGDPNIMLQSAVRANTLREIRATLVSRVAHARAAASEPTEE